MQCLKILNTLWFVSRRASTLSSMHMVQEAATSLPSMHTCQGSGAPCTALPRERPGSHSASSDGDLRALIWNILAGRRCWVS